MAGSWLPAAERTASHSPLAGQGSFLPNPSTRRSKRLTSAPVPPHTPPNTHTHDLSWFTPPLALEAMPKVLSVSLGSQARPCSPVPDPTCLGYLSQKPTRWAPQASKSHLVSVLVSNVPFISRSLSKPEHMVPRTALGQLALSPHPHCITVLELPSTNSPTQKDLLYSSSAMKLC